jgi:hypothetical protein
MQLLFMLKSPLLNQNQKLNLMDLEFQFLNIHTSHLTQLGIITIILKCQKKKSIIVCNFQGPSTTFLVPISVF